MAEHSIRQICGIPDTSPVLVDIGDGPTDLGLDTIIQGLQRLPAFHLVLVRPHGDLSFVFKQVEAYNVADRVHVLSPSQCDEQVLTGATFGLIPATDLTGEALLPTKLNTYLRSRLPVIACDDRALGEYIRHHKIGEVFVSGNPKSFATKALRAISNNYPGVDLLAGHQRLHTDTPWPRIGSRPIRLGLGTANYCGQLAAFAAAICGSRKDVSAEVVMAKRAAAFAHPADVHLDTSRLGELDVQVQQIRRVMGTYTHLIADAFRPVLGWFNGKNIASDLPALAQAGIVTALLAHGSEVRHPGDHQARHEFSLFEDAPTETVEKLTALSEQNRETAATAGLPVFVTTPDLLDDLPQAVWAPLVVDVAAWACDTPVLERERPVVLHAPSARWTKGTDRILPVLENLSNRGKIEFRVVENLEHSDMRTVVQNADIVVDQLMVGSYGTLACEAMAAGKPVIAYLSRSAVEHIGVTPPIVNATVESLESVLLSLLDDRDVGRQIGVDSAQYVHDVHDGRRTAAVFNDFLDGRP